MTTDELGDGIRGLVARVMGMQSQDVRPADQRAPAGGQTKDFATVKIITMDSVGTPGISEENIDGDDDNLTTNVDQTLQFVASVQFFRGRTSAGAGNKDAAGLATFTTAAVDRARRLGQRLWLPSSVALMQQMRVGLISVGDARNLAAVSDANYESRGGVDITFNVISRESEVTPAIRHVPISIAMQAPDGELVTRTDEVST